MATSALFRADSYRGDCLAVITKIDDSGIYLDQTIFYPRSGGQSGDTGALVLQDETRLEIGETHKASFPGATPDDVVHLPLPGQEAALSRLTVGMHVRAEIDWARRYNHMRLHTACHLVCALVPYPVDGCGITGDTARLDFVTLDPIDKVQIGASLAELIATESPVKIGLILDEDLKARPELIRSMSVSPPVGYGSVRLVTIGDIDIQPCGGTHVLNTSEIGTVRVTKIEKKTARTRRITIKLD
ncbi:Ala-tRNA(Pro) hydrolase [Pseudomonas syringae]|nr:hypothetical protein ALQ59_200145 [Pseudomonas syringae pv. apii]RMN56183.1 hypothetical protein ALQ58_200061 [Pseudomonas syringae pv. apii]SDZ38824.1 Ala-tRNA(Pro) hydrolase [Pseudomonas syringae]